MSKREVYHILNYRKKNNLSEKMEKINSQTSKSKILKEKTNTECPICLTDETPMHILSCKHQIHTDCVKNMVKLECPLCRQEMKNLPVNIKKRIIKKEKEYKEELEEEQFNEFLESQPNIEIFDEETEEYIAQEYLQNLNIPDINMPENFLHLSFNEIMLQIVENFDKQNKNAFELVKNYQELDS